jgi:hypothetical protein
MHLHRKTILNTYEKSLMPKSSKVISCNIIQVLTSYKRLKIMSHMTLKFNLIMMFQKYLMKLPSLGPQMIKSRWSSQRRRKSKLKGLALWTQWESWPGEVRTSREIADQALPHLPQMKKYLVFLSIVSLNVTLFPNRMNRCKINPPETKLRYSRTIAKILISWIQKPMRKKEHII